MIWWQTPRSLCNKRLLRCQKVTVVCVTNTYTAVQCTPTWQIVRKSKQVLKTSITDANTSSQTFYDIHWYELHQWLSAATHVTCQSSTASVRWHHGSASSLVLDRHNKCHEGVALTGRNSTGPTWCVTDDDSRQTPDSIIILAPLHYV